MKPRTVKIIEEFECNHNHSWYEELYNRNRETLDDTALFYRGNNISYEEMFLNMNLLAHAMQSVGVKKGIEIPVCLSNSPELVYVMGAASMLGAIINVFSSSFPLDFINEILSSSDHLITFIEDNHYEVIHNVLKTVGFKYCILCSLSDSLPAGISPETVQGHEYVSFKSKVKSMVSQTSRTFGFYDFMSIEKSQELDLSDRITLEDEFTVTYTSGSTNALRPKAIVQRVRSFCVIARFHDPDIMRGMKFKKIRGLAIIPPHSNTDLISSISDTLMQGAVLAMEPVYNENFFLDALLINKPSFVSATRSFWITAMKKIVVENAYEHNKLPFLLFAFAVGEELSINEEQFLNKALRKAKSGCDMRNLPFFLHCFSVAGGDCEHGSILYRLFRAVSNLTIKPYSEKRYGMRPFDFVDIAVLDPFGNRLGPNKVGKLVANSPCTMKCYKNDPAATEAFFVRDSNNIIWGNMNVYGYIDKYGKVYMRNRIINDLQVIPPFQISDEVLKSKDLLSCETVCVGDKYIAHIEFFPGRERNQEELLRARKRCEKCFGREISENLFFRIHSGPNSFSLTGSGKRNIKGLIAEGMSEAFQV